ncbi:MAG: transporter [Hyphomicrobiales bacterium]|nr:transporter [Hyphomicrobiales bacterium]
MTLAFAIAIAPSIAAADDDEAPKAPGNPFYTLETKNLFGFLEGADVGEQGDRSLEFETTGSFGRQQGGYNSIEQEIIFEPTLTDSLGVEFGAHLLGQDIHGVPGLPDFAGVNFMGGSVELRYVVMHRTADLPIQLTVTAEPEYSVMADAGRQTNDYSTSFRAIADVISVDQRLYGAINLVYEPDGARLPGQPWQSTALLSASAALSYRPTPALMFGGEADYDRAYGGLVPRGFEGQAFYLGPTFHYQINEKIDLSAAFIAQTPFGRVDFEEFPRQLAKLRLEVEF